MVDYIYVQTEPISLSGGVTKTGYLIYMSLINSLDFSAGVDTVDLSIVQTTDRSLFPTSGLKKDFEFDFELIDDGTNKCFSVDNIGNLTPLNKITTKEQVNFLLNNIITNQAVARYFIYSEWLDEEYYGHLIIRGRASGDEFFNKVTVRATFKSGANSLALFATTA